MGKRVLNVSRAAGLVLAALVAACGPGGGGGGGDGSVTPVSRFIDDGALSVECLCTPSGVIALDISGDGLSDLVTANVDGSSASVFLGNAGGFLAPVPYPFSGAARPETLVVNDFTGDSEPDLVVTDATTSEVRSIRVRVGVGNGVFDTNTEKVTPLSSSTVGPPSLATGHFNSDSDADALLDLVVANLTDDTVSILRSNGDGTFTQATVFSNLTDGISTPLGVTVADFDQNLLDDLAVANNGNDSVRVFLQTAPGTFQTPPQNFEVLGNPSAIAAVDLNADSFPDLVVTAGVGNSVSFFVNAQSGQLFGSPVQTLPTGVGPVAVTVGDFNRDGQHDLVVVNNVLGQPQGSVTTYLGLGTGMVSASETYTVGGSPLAAAVGDFNGDQWPDLAVANSADDTITILRNRGN